MIKTRKNKKLSLLPFDSEIERTFLKRLRERRKKINMAETVENANGERALRDYAVPSIIGSNSSIRRPPIAANNFEIKPAIIQMIQTSVQFGGLATDDPNAHITNFLEICDTFKHNGVSDDAIRLRLFPFSLRDKAKGWLNSLPQETIST